MAGANIYTATLDRVIALAQGVTAIGSNRAFQSYKRFAEATNFEKDVELLTAQTQGYFIAELGECERSQDGLDLPPFTIKAELVCHVPKETSSDLSSAWDMAIDLAETLTTSTNYDGSLNQAQCARIRWRKHSHDIIETGGVLRFDFGKYGFGGLEFIDP